MTPAAASLTGAQTAIWLDQAFHAGRPIYNTGQTIRIRMDFISFHFAAEADHIRDSGHPSKLAFDRPVLKRFQVRQ